MTLRKKTLACFAAALFGACTTASTDLGTMTVGSHTFAVSREGDAPTAGAMTRFVIKPTAGDQPTSVTGWVGLEDAADSDKTLAVFDSVDGDFDDDLTVPSPLPPGSEFWIDVDSNGTIETSSITLK